ncbi:MAG: BrnA antitoxin family protein [Candidatus Binatus sp.]
MRKNENIARFSADRIRRKLARGESETDWKRADAISQTKVERLADKNEGVLPAGWENTVMVGLPPAKQDIHIRLDGDILDWFKARGRGYQTRINAVLRAFVQTRQRVERKPATRSQSRRVKDAAKP